MLVDTHCHLYLLEDRPEEVLGRARAAGVGHLVDVGVDLESSRLARANARRLEGVSATAGVHPHEALVVHCRDAFPDVMAILEGEGALDRVVLHCFSGDAPMAERVVRAGYHVSFAGTVTFKNAPKLREACAVVPLDRMVLETDSPYLSPHPFRGRPNSPERVAVTAETVAAVHGVDVERVAEATTATAVRAFRLPLRAVRGAG